MRHGFHRDPKVYRYAVVFKANGVLTLGNADNSNDLFGPADVVAYPAKLSRRGPIEKQAGEFVTDFKKSVGTGK